jgi:hypothetical protein
VRVVYTVGLSLAQSAHASHVGAAARSLAADPASAAEFLRRFAAGHTASLESSSAVVESAAAEEARAQAATRARARAEAVGGPTKPAPPASEALPAPTAPRRWGLNPRRWHVGPATAAGAVAGLLLVAAGLCAFLATAAPELPETLGGAEPSCGHPYRDVSALARPATASGTRGSRAPAPWPTAARGNV